MRAVREFAPLFDFAATPRPQTLHLRRFDEFVPRTGEEQDGELGGEGRDGLVGRPDLMQEERDEGGEERQDARDELWLRGEGKGRATEG